MNHLCHVPGRAWDLGPGTWDLGAGCGGRATARLANGPERRAATRQDSVSFDIVEVA